MTVSVPLNLGLFVIDVYIYLSPSINTQGLPGLGGGGAVTIKTGMSIAASVSGH